MKDPDAGKVHIDDSDQYRANYHPDDDCGGLPLVALIPCPFSACLYNRLDEFEGMENLKANLTAAKAEQLRQKSENVQFDWDNSPAHCALYATDVDKTEVISAFVVMGSDQGLADTLFASLGDTIPLLRLHSTKFKHGNATRLRYDVDEKKAGFVQERFEEWWATVDDNNDGKMSYDEMNDMLNDMTTHENDRTAENKSAVQAQGTMAITLHGLGTMGVGTGAKVEEETAEEVFGVTKKDMEDLYAGNWKGKMKPLTSGKMAMKIVWQYLHQTFTL
jgi:hypothetical protein